MTIFVLFTAGFTLCVGIFVLWANPQRFTNQIFSTTSLIIAAQLLFISRAIQAGIIFIHDHATNPRLELQAAGAMAAFFP